MNINKKRIVITGGTSGIGYQMVKYLQSNNEIIVISKNENRLVALSKEFENVITYQADLSKLEEVESVAKLITERFQKIDVLINNAAVQYTPTFIDNAFKYDSINHEIMINFTSICCLTYLLLPALTHQNKAAILMINTGLALAPKTTSAIYCATKSALNNFTQSLRYQLENSNISVQQAFLELVETGMTAGRGNNKMSAEEASKIIIKGLKEDVLEHDIGKVKLLRLLLRLVPSVAKKIMKKY
ncbi:SDR family NAD(P)-dependent oxidoreductase [Psychromonas algicola]|uniref:SDR family NAD(P)-dependent oxidoreductase n=1 Tax=Psychromonas algicola TaxID=2555642 RepID=UPI001067D0B3|nr:SDR family NAD(P)-dependent oxidoreductase [Psychromonas sp. RZ5]TEW44072.1 SDR family NAD(P)-dependent oxidoreductase [Psychromonas sp. RZ5]